MPQASVWVQPGGRCRLCLHQVLVHLRNGRARLCMQQATFLCQRLVCIRVPALWVKAVTAAAAYIQCLGRYGGAGHCGPVRALRMCSVGERNRHHDGAPGAFMAPPLASDARQLSC